jgi:predicted acylesterase/phospholipase RssA
LDLASSRRVTFAGGSLADGVGAASAIPGLFDPFHIDDHVLADGGWAEPQ